MKQRRDVEWAQSLFFCFNKEENNGDNSANYKMKVGGGGGKGTTEWSLIEIHSRITHRLLNEDYLETNQCYNRMAKKWFNFHSLLQFFSKRKENGVKTNISLFLSYPCFSANDSSNSCIRRRGEKSQRGGGLYNQWTKRKIDEKYK